VLNEFAVQGGRWYSTTVVMSNGSILVMGGEAGAGGAADPTVEILPRVPGGSTKVSLDFLQRTNPNNLYPFVNILPSGRLFVGEFEIISLTSLIDTHGQGTTMRRVFLTQ
jgi:glyoxal oxidase-like protein